MFVLCFEGSIASDARWPIHVVIHDHVTTWVKESISKGYRTYYR